MKYTFFFGLHSVEIIKKIRIMTYIAMLSLGYLWVHLMFYCAKTEGANVKKTKSNSRIGCCKPVSAYILIVRQLFVTRGSQNGQCSQEKSLNMTLNRFFFYSNDFV